MINSNDQKNRKITILSVVILAFTLLGLPVLAQEGENQMPQQESMPQQEQAPGQDYMQEQDQMQPENQTAPMPQQQSINTDYSEAELKKFIDANMEATKVQQETQMKMVKVIEDEGLEVQTFNEIMTAQQNPQREVEASESELKKFDKAAEKVMVMQEEMQTEVVGAIEKTGMDVDKYSEIMLAYQNSPVVQEKVHKLMKTEQGGK